MAVSSCYTRLTTASALIILTPNQQNTNPFRYAGEYWDWETQTYYLRARHFNPRTGRFTQPDPFWNISNMTSNTAAVLQSGNLFVYTMHNPVRFIDPTGLFSYEYEGTGNCPIFTGQSNMSIGFTNGHSSASWSSVNGEIFQDISTTNTPVPPGAAWGICHGSTNLGSGFLTPTGGGFQFYGNPTMSQKAAFAIAILYLARSATALGYIKDVMSSSQTTLVEFISGPGHYWWTFQVGTGRIGWDPTYASRVGEFTLGFGRINVTSPAIVLFHEIVHAWQNLNGLHIGRGLEWLEDEAWKREAAVARELGEPQRRFYGDSGGHVNVDCPTAWGQVFRKPRGPRVFVRSN